MEDLGEVVENFVETFSCSEEASSRLPANIGPVAKGNLLAASPKYGFSFAAVGSSIGVYTHASIRDGDARPVALVDLNEGNTTSIHSLALGPYDTLLAHVSIDSKRFVIILSIHALASGKIHALPSPSREASAFTVGDPGLKETPPVLAIVEEGCVQLYLLNAQGSTPSTKISISKPICIAISPDSVLLAVGTERGSVVVYDTKRGNTLTTIVEVESGWVPFSVHFADDRAILVSYNCNAEVRHVIWHLSSDGTTVSGHSALGELCLASLSCDDYDDDEDEEDEAPTITCISLHEWAMCVIGSSKSGDVEIIKKTDYGWEVWKFDEGKSPTLPNDDDDDDTCCLGLAFDINNTNPIPGPDAASPKINPMPRVIVYTSDSLLLPFALIDGTPGMKCDAIRLASELLPAPENLRSIQAALTSQDYRQTQLEKRKQETSAILSDDARSRPRNYDYSLHHTKAEQTVAAISSGSDASATETFGDPRIEESNTSEFFKMNTSQTREAQRSLAFPSFENSPNSGYDEKGVKSFLGNFSFSETSKAEPISPTMIPTPHTNEMNLAISQPEPTIVSSGHEKPKVLLAPSLQKAEAEASRGDLLDLLKSIMAEMSEELRVSTEAERLVSHEISAQKESIVLSITETRKQLSKLLEETRGLFRNEADSRTAVSKTLSKVLTMSREYESISLEFRVREADGFSRSLRAEEKEIDEKISRKETEVIRSIADIEDRLNAETKFQTRKTSPAEVVQQVYSSLSLQGIRIKRIRSLLTALKERMDNQDKGGRLSDLGLSLARLETLNIHDEEVPVQSQTTEGSRKRLSGDREAIVTRSSGGNESDAIASGIQGDDTQLLSPDVRAVMRRLAMSGGRASIRTIVPAANLKQDRTAALNKASAAPINDDPNIAGLSDAAAMARSIPSEVLATTLPEPGTSAFASSKSWATVSARRPLESKATRQTHDSHSQIIPSFPITLETSNSRIADKVDRKRSHMLPPKRPSIQPPFASSVQPSNTLGFLSNSPDFGNKKKDAPSRQSREGTAPADKLDSSDFIEVNKSAVPQSETAMFSTRAEGFSGSSQEVSLTFRSEVKSGVHHDIQSSGIANPFSDKTASGLEKPRKSGLIPFAGLPPDDDVHQETRESKSTPVFEKSEKSRSIPLARLPPDEDVPQPEQDMTSNLGFGKSKRSNLVPFAGLPPDDDDEIPNKNDSDGAVSSFAPNQNAITHSKSENKTPKSGSESGFFAALPPNSDEEQTRTTSKEEKAENSLLHTQERKDRVQLQGLFAALPPDADNATENVQSVTVGSKGGKSALPFGESKSGTSDPTPEPREKTEGSFGTSDLFATLPPEDSGTEQARPSGTFGTGSVIESNMGKNVIEPVEASKSRTKESIFGSSFETNQQSSAPFGKASLFGVNSSMQPSIADVTDPQVSSSMDAGSTDDSDEEPTRFGGGMDTSSGTGSLFGAPSSAQDSKQPFGFGPSLSDGAQTTGFSQSGVSPFASFGSSQPFGQSSSQTGYGSHAGSQSTFPSSFSTPQPAFGETSGFGATSAAPSFGVQSSLGASQLGAPSSFGMPSQIGATSAPFGSSSPPFGGGMTAAKFGESSFGMTSSLGGFTQSSSGSGFASSSSSSGASPFGQISGSNGFGSTSGGGSGFAALAGSQSGPLIFGSGSGPPAFTSAAFSQRRA